MEIQADLMQQAFVLTDYIHTLLPNLALWIDAAELSFDDDVEFVKMLLCPLYACTHHQGRETLLIDADRVLDDSKVDKRGLENVSMKIPFKHALPNNVSWCNAPQPHETSYLARFVISSLLLCR